MGEQNSNKFFEAKMVKFSEGNEVSYCPERGGIITSLKLQGKEFLYLDQGTFQDDRANVRGGIPILFPNAGALKSLEFPKLCQHGFVRNFSGWVAENDIDGFSETFIASEETKKLYPYDFRLTVAGKFEKDNSFTLLQIVENLEGEKDLPISMGLHPYFSVPNKEKKNIKFNFEGGNIIEEKFADWSNGNFVSIDNPKLKDASAKLEIVIPFLGTLLMDISPEYQKIWVWSLPEKDFICIEPVMRDVGGLVDNPEKIKPRQIFSASLKLTLKT